MRRAEGREKLFVRVAFAWWFLLAASYYLHLLTCAPFSDRNPFRNRGAREGGGCVRAAPCGDYEPTVPLPRSTVYSAAVVRQVFPPSRSATHRG